jgi:phage gpG-like protein
MARVNVRHSFDMGAVRVMQTNPVGGVARDMYRRGQNVRAEAQRLAGEDTGRLRASIHVEHVERNGVVGARVGSNVEYAAAHHEGHGALVPRRPGGVMVFRPRGGPLVFTKKVRPVEGTEYLRKALPAARD